MVTFWFFLFVTTAALHNTFGQNPCPAFPPGGRCGRSCSSNLSCQLPQRCICNIQCGKNCNFPPVRKCLAPDIEFGFATYASLTVGSSANYYCRDDYQLRGSTTRICQIDLSWSGDDPLCIQTAEICYEQPPALTNGRYVYVASAGKPVGSDVVAGEVDWSVGDRMEYRCNNGYFLNDTTNPVWTCTETGDWMGKPLSCIPCVKVPPDSVCGRRRCSGQRDCLRNEVCSCSSRQCGGRFCIQPYCTRPENIENGYITGHVHNFPSDVITYSCHEGYRLDNADATRTCLTNGQWSLPDLKCIKRGDDPTDCPTLPGIVNGYILYENQNAQSVGSVAIYICFNAYVLTGTSSRTCLPGGKWSGEEPHCSADFCYQNPPDLTNGRYVFVSSVDTSNTELALTDVDWKVGDRMEYRCNQGFYLNDTSNPIWTCTKSGTWTGKSLSCIACIQVRPGTECGRRRCSGQGDCFSHEVCSCSSRQCGGRFCIQPYCTKPNSLANGYITGSATGRVGDTITYFCYNGYRLNTRSSTRSCLRYGTWSGEEPFCIERGDNPVRCPILRNVKAASLTYSDGQLEGSEATYRCNSVSRLVGAGTRTCLATGVWSGAEPKCVPIILFCTSPPYLVHGRYQASPGTGGASIRGYRVGQVIQYTCDVGFEINTVESRKTCLEDGTWSGPTLTCSRKAITRCPIPTLILNGVVSTNGVNPGSAQYSCNPGYELYGNRLRECLTDGTWSGEKPTCVQNVGFCNNPPSILNGWYKLVYKDTDQSNAKPDTSDADLTRYGVGQMVEYGCRSGFQLNFAETKKTCLRDGSWSGSSLQCVPVVSTPAVCPMPRPPRNGYIALCKSCPVTNFPGITVGDVLTYECAIGYTLVGRRTRVCVTRTRRWSYLDPLCQFGKLS
uniref:Sushi, von Willebrand factor type A, EGF and pentraxin domain-containing protein 1-like n=1 Tax=Phallusia mammillata TaxID=59560 RepID=A0A6F9DU66_9ASCI|nr:sushi, von Willebrand factor type A, EGF and pentraxin domain-containing protein 1-like [Phallusia mammillata]